MSKIWDLQQHKGKTALIDELGNQMNYDVLNSEANILSERIGHRCLVFALCRNEIGSVLGYTAFINNGIVPVMVNSHLEEALLQNLLETYSPEYLWLPKDQVEQFAGMSVEHESHNYVLLKTGYEKKYPLFDELGLLITTSGSTGSPKLVRQSYTNVLDNAQSIVKYLKLDDTERPITTLPMNYVYGLSIINSHFLVGATLLLTDKGLMQKEFWSFFKEQEATSFGGVPYTYEMLDKLRFFRMKLPSLRTMTQAGGKITPELHEKFAAYAAEQGKNFVVMYGAAEATARMGYLPPEKAVEKKGSMGIPIPGGVFHLIGAGVFCGIYLIIKFRNEDLKDRQFLNDTLNWNDRDLKIFMAPLRIIFPIYMIVSVFVLSVRRIVQLYRLRKFFRECVAKLADNPDEITG